MNLPTYMLGTTQTRAYAILRERVRTSLSKHGLIPSQWAMLGIILEARDGIRQADVASAMNVKPPLITVMVRELQKRDLLESVPNQFDSRAKLINVTAHGRKFMKSTENDLKKELNTLLTGLTEADLVVYNKVLTTIITNNK